MIEECYKVPTETQCNAYTESKATFGTDINAVPWNDDPTTYNTMEKWCEHEANEGLYACVNMSGAGTFCKPMCDKMKKEHTSQQ